MLQVRRHLRIWLRSSNLRIGTSSAIPQTVPADGSSSSGQNGPRRFPVALSKEFPTWALAMQIVGSFTPNSAAAERVFSLLKSLFGDMQKTSLADMIQAALMLRYNGRKVG